MSERTRKKSRNSMLMFVLGSMAGGVAATMGVRLWDRYVLKRESTPRVLPPGEEEQQRQQNPFQSQFAMPQPHFPVYLPIPTSFPMPAAPMPPSLPPPPSRNPSAMDDDDDDDEDPVDAALKEWSNEDGIEW